VKNMDKEFWKIAQKLIEENKELLEELKNM